MEDDEIRQHIMESMYNNPEYWPDAWKQQMLRNSEDYFPDAWLQRRSSNPQIEYDPRRIVNVSL